MREKVFAWDSGHFQISLSGEYVGSNSNIACGVGVRWGKEERERFLFLSNGRFEGECSLPEQNVHKYRCSFEMDSVVTIILDCNLREIKVLIDGKVPDGYDGKFIFPTDEVVFYPCVRFGGFKGEKFQSI